MNRLAYCFHPLHKDWKVPIPFPDWARKAKTYLLPLGRFDFPYAKREAIRASATYLFYAVRFHRGELVRVHSQDRKLTVEVTDKLDRRCAVHDENTLCHNQSIPNERDKITSLQHSMPLSRTTSISAFRPNSYDRQPKPTTFPIHTAETIEDLRNSSRAYTFERCTSTTGIPIALIASR